MSIIAKSAIKAEESKLISPVHIEGQGKGIFVIVATFVFRDVCGLIHYTMDEGKVMA